MSSESLNLIYILTESCNFKCSYCYEGEKDYTQGSSYMDSKMMLDIFDTFRLDANNNEISITFFGGEPLLLFSEIKDFIETLKFKYKRLPKFKIITNGYLMEQEIADYISSNFDSITISIDGNKDTHNKYRITSTGKDTYEIVSHNIRKLSKENGLNIHFEITVTNGYLAYNSDLLTDEIWKIIKELEADSVDFIPVYGENYSFFHDIEKSQHIIKNFINRWFDELITCNKSFDIASFTGILLSTLKASEQKQCTAGISYFAIDPKLNIYSCQTEVFKDVKPIGVIKENVKEINSIKREYTNNICKDCNNYLGCSCYCEVMHDDNSYNDICKRHRFARTYIEQKIIDIYEEGMFEEFCQAVKHYYAK